MKRSYIGEIGELSVLNKLLKQEYEGYRANSRIQKGWDLVVILKNDIVLRIQVKTTILQNKSKNNSVTLGKNYDYLIIVVIDENNNFNYYILSKRDVEEIQEKNKKLSISEKNEDTYKVKENIIKYQNKLGKIKEAKNGKNN